MGIRTYWGRGGGEGKWAADTMETNVLEEVVLTAGKLTNTETRI